MLYIAMFPCNKSSEGKGPNIGKTGYGRYFYDFTPWDFWDYSDYYDFNKNLILDDNEIRYMVKDTIDADWAIPKRDRNSIEVDVIDGVAILRGRVRARKSKIYAYNDTFWSRGVIDVINNIQIK